VGDLTVLCRRRVEEEVEEEQEPETSTTATQTEGDESVADDAAESVEMAELREEVITTVFLHPAPTPSPARKPARHATTAFSGPEPSKSSPRSSSVTSPPEPIERLSTEEIEQRLHSHGTGTKNVKPG